MPTRHTAGARRRKKPRTLETTVSDIANRPPPIRRSIFDLLDTLIKSREQPAEPPDPPRPAPKTPKSPRSDAK